jgi:hypothetical protein
VRIEYSRNAPGGARIIGRPTVIDGVRVTHLRRRGGTRFTVRVPADAFVGKPEAQRVPDTESWISGGGEALDWLLADALADAWETGEAS